MFNVILLCIDCYLLLKMFCIEKKEFYFNKSSSANFFQVTTGNRYFQCNVRVYVCVCVCV